MTNIESVYYVDVGDPASGILDFDGSTSFSYGAWVKPGVQDTNGRVISKKDNTGADVEYDLFVNPDMSVCIRIGDGTNQVFPCSDTLPYYATQNAWNFIMVVVNRSAGDVRIYVNGIDTTGSQSLGSLGSVAGTPPLGIRVHLSQSPR